MALGQGRGPGHGVHSPALQAFQSRGGDRQESDNQQCRSGAREKGSGLRCPRSPTAARVERASRVGPTVWLTSPFLRQPP